MFNFLEGTYLISIVSFIWGLKFLSNPKKAKFGNWIASMGMALALGVTFVSLGINGTLKINIILVGASILLATILGKVVSKRVEMTEMPQLVSFFNATGGACAVFIGIIEASRINSLEPVQFTSLLLGLFCGGVATSGSVLALRKLSRKVSDYRYSWIKVLSRGLLLTSLLLITGASFGWIGFNFLQLSLILGGLALCYGVLFVLPIGGADMPVVISLLNSITGITTALAGILLDNKIMLAGGIIVGASGILLTIMMCKAMNRSLIKVLTGSFKGSNNQQTSSGEQVYQEGNVAETALLLGLSKRVAIIPGYGLAVAQAQHILRQTQKLLVAKGIHVDFIIHPVAGRMPGHMNVLLAEAGIEYKALKEMDEVNEEMSSYDLALIIGANDVVNPAAETNSSSPIFGMPIIKAYQSNSVVVLKRSMAKGYAGVENELFNKDKCKILFGDAKESLQLITNELKLI